jgi:hypothetical protein
MTVTFLIGHLVAAWGHSANNDLSIEVLRDFCTRETFLRSVPCVFAFISQHLSKKVIVTMAPLPLLLLLLVATAAAEVNELGQESYDIDSSWAIHSTKLKDTFGDKQRLYDDFMNGCRASIPEGDASSCNDEYRINMNVHQPPGMRVCIYINGEGGAFVSFDSEKLTFCSCAPFL